MNRNLLFFIPLFLSAFFTIQQTHAVCVKNNTDLQLSYEIFNQNTGCSVPKVKYHSGILQPHQKQCHAHSQEDGGNDWKIYRHDLIKVVRQNNDGEQQKIACNKLVEGIINTLEVDYHPWSSTWWCLDRSDYED